MPDSLAERFEDARRTLRRLAPRWRDVGDWPAESLRACGDAGLFAGLVLSSQDREALSLRRGTPAWEPGRQVETLIELARQDLITTFVITQHLGAIKQLLRSDQLKQGSSET